MVAAAETADRTWMYRRWGRECAWEKRRRARANPENPKTRKGFRFCAASENLPHMMRNAIDVTE